MDPVNLSGTQNIPSDCKSYAGIRSPAGCACCGLKDYPQNIPHAYCSTVLCPGVSKCKSAQDHHQDNFAIPHPFFSSFPFQQHFFHNSIIPPNFCCSQIFDDEGTNPGQTQSRNEQKINQHQADHYAPPQREKSDFAGTNRNINEDAQKNGPVSGPETTSPYSDPTESQPNTVFHRCVCGDSIPWACRPLIVPVISYCLLWNSPTTAPTLLPKTYNGYITETLCQKNSKKQSTQKYTSTSDYHEQLDSLNQEHMSTCDVANQAPCDTNLDSAEISQECSEVRELSKTQLKVDEQEEEKEQTEQEENECIKNDSDEIYEEEDDESETGDDSEVRDRTESEESLKVDENDSPAPDSSENLSKDLECRGTPDTESSTNLKSVPKSSEDSLSDALPENTARCWETEVTDVNSSAVPNEESEEKNSDSEDPDNSTTNLKELVIKKCIKNFTVTDNINGVRSRDLLMSAAGDLGGESCDTCKILISLDETIEEISKESFNTGVIIEECEPKRRNVEEIHRSGYKFKSGIAKLSKNSNLKAPKSNTFKTTKKCKNNSNEKQSNAVRIKHCCFPADNTNSKTGSSSKVQKVHKLTIVQNSAPVKSSVLSKIPGPEIPKKSLNTRQTLKKENILRKPARPVNISNNSQKAVKTLLKK